MVGQVTNQELYYNVTGQYLIHDAELVPTSPTVAVYEAVDSDDATAASATTGSASADTTSLTVATAYDPQQSDPLLLVLNATTGLAEGRRYLIAAATGEHEIFELQTLSTSAKIRHPLANAYAIGATVKGLRISIAVDPTWIADADSISQENVHHPRYRVRWKYTAGGVTVVRATYVDVVRYQAAHSVTALDIDAVHPGWMELLPTRERNDQGRSLIAAAYRQVRLDVAGEEHGLARARNAEVIDALVIEKTNALAQQSRLERGGGSIEAVDAAVAVYERRFNQLIRSPGIRWDQDGSGAAAHVTPMPFLRR